MTNSSAHAPLEWSSAGHAALGLLVVSSALLACGGAASSAPTIASDAGAGNDSASPADSSDPNIIHVACALTPDYVCQAEPHDCSMLMIDEARSSVCCFQGCDRISESPCDGYDVVEFKGSKGKVDYYYDHVTGKLVANILLDPTGEYTCEKGPPDFVVPQCATSFVCEVPPRDGGNG
jgi:hypothetical protein